MSSFNSTTIICKYDIYISPTDLISLLLSLNITWEGECALKLMCFSVLLFIVFIWPCILYNELYIFSAWWWLQCTFLTFVLVFTVNLLLMKIPQLITLRLNYTKFPHRLQQAIVKNEIFKLLTVSHPLETSSLIKWFLSKDNADWDYSAFLQQLWLWKPSVRTVWKGNSNWDQTSKAPWKKWLHATK